MRAPVKGWGRRLSKPQRKSRALTADVLTVIRLTAVQPRRRGHGIETPEQDAERGKFDVALVAVLSDAGLRRSEATALTWGEVHAGTTARAASPWSAPRPTWRPRAPPSLSPPPSWKRLPPSGWPAWSAVRKCSGCQNRRSPGASRQSPKPQGWRLGVLQRAQRARRHGKAHGPERRAHPRDRAPGPLETRRRHGRPLYPRRDRRVSAQISVSDRGIPCAIV